MTTTNVTLNFRPKLFILLLKYIILNLQSNLSYTNFKIEFNLKSSYQQF